MQRSHRDFVRRRHELIDHRRAVKMWNKLLQQALNLHKPNLLQKLLHVAQRCRHRNNDLGNIFQIAPCLNLHA